MTSSPEQPHPEYVEARTREWVDSFVIELNLCPFARSVVQRGLLRVCVCEATDPVACLETLADEAIALLRENAREATTLLVLPRCAETFNDYLRLLDVAEQILSDAGLDGDIQLASFHPDYVFEDSAADDPANRSNRSPYPMWHLLREAAVTDAVERHPDTEAIPARNAEALRILAADSASDDCEGL